jgi:hypothetical protein
MATIPKGLIYEDNFSEQADTAIVGGRGVVLTPSGAGISAIGTAGAYADAISIFDGAIGDEVAAQRGGIVNKAEAGAAIGDGVKVATDNLGRFIPYVAGSGIYVSGKSRTPAVNPGDFFELVHYEAPSQ